MTTANLIKTITPTAAARIMYYIICNKRLTPWAQISCLFSCWRRTDLNVLGLTGNAYRTHHDYYILDFQRQYRCNGRSELTGGVKDFSQRRTQDFISGGGGVWDCVPSQRIVIKRFLKLLFGRFFLVISQGVWPPNRPLVCAAGLGRLDFNSPVNILLRGLAVDYFSS